MDFSGQLVGLDNIKRYVFGGHAVFTLVSKKTGTRYTYKLQLPKHDENSRYPAPDPKTGPFFAKVLTGPENESDYTFLGTTRLRDGRPSYTHSGKSRVSSTAPSVVAFEWFLRALDGDRISKLDAVEVFHTGTCCRCGRALTVPESVASGIGPVCAGRE